AGVAHVGRERLGEERAENRAIARPDDRETDHHRDQQPREGLLVHHPEEGEGVQGHRDGAADEHLLAPRTPPNPASCTTPTDRWPPPSACRCRSPAGGQEPLEHWVELARAGAAELSGELGYREPTPRTATSDG